MPDDRSVGQCLLHAMAWNISTLVSYDPSECVEVFDNGEESDSRPPAPTIHIEVPVSKDFIWCRYAELPQIRLVSFTYGKDPTDWKFYFALIFEDYFRQFWEMVENGMEEREMALPGAWVEEDIDEMSLDFEYDIEHGRDFDGKGYAGVSPYFNPKLFPPKW
jgi:hypothetical protein